MLFFISFLIISILLFAAIKLRNTEGKFTLVSNFLLILSSLIFSLILAEGLLGLVVGKTSNPDHPTSPPYFTQYQPSTFFMIENSILYTALPKKSYRTFGLPYDTNWMGFREKEFEAKKPKDVFRILVFGDSVTFGAAVATQQRYTFILEKLLNIHLTKINHTAIKEVEVLNFGIPGYATDQIHDLIKGQLELLECDLVLVGFFHNDLTITTQDTLESYAMQDSKNKGKIFVKIPPLSNPKRNLKTIPKSMPVEFLKTSSGYEKFNLYKFLKNRTNLFLSDENTNSKLWDYVINEFLGIKSITKNHKLPDPYILLLPSGHVDPDKNNFANPSGELAERIQTLTIAEKKLQKSGMPTINPLPLFKDHSFMSMAVSEWDTHPNYLAHYLYAQAIFDHLIKDDFPKAFQK
jgi:hypothetical protein